MRDGPLRVALKFVARSVWSLELGARRALTAQRWQLTGDCGGCASCCERPSITVGKALWYLPWSRATFMAWQRHVNGFELIEAERETRTFVFRCSHFDWETRRCDSYASRPFMCRDYPRALLDGAWPELFEGCGYALRDREGAGMAEALDRADLSPQKREELKRRLRLK